MKVYSVDEVREILSTSPAVVRELIKKNMIVCLKLKSIKIPDYAIEEFFRKYEGMDLSNLEDIKKLNKEE